AIKNLILAGGDSVGGVQGTVSNRRLNAYGSLTCSGSTVLSRLLPSGSSATIAVDSSLTLELLNIDCARPNEAVGVTVGAAGSSVTLLYHGLGPDRVAGAGIYSATLTPPAPGTHMP